jgi:tripartite-type tricarboxylate transporter receptor subunit TctC
VIAQINQAVNESIAVPAVAQQLVREGADPAGGSPAQFRDFVQREYEKWRVVVIESGQPSNDARVLLAHLNRSALRGTNPRSA